MQKKEKLICLYVHFPCLISGSDMENAITEYYTIAHSKPLVFVPNMSIIYFKGGISGYQVSSRFLEHIMFHLEHIIEKGGEFKVMNLHSQQRDMRICAYNGDGTSVIGITSRDVIWTKWWISFIKVQRRLHWVLWYRHGSASLKLIKAFQKTDRAKTIPSEIMSCIIHVYFQPPSRPLCTNNASGVPIRKILTNSYKLQELNLPV